MPTLGQVTTAVLPTANNLLVNALRNRGLRNATNTVVGGASRAGQRIVDASGRAIGREDKALEEQRGLYGTSMQNARDLYDKTVTDQTPYQQTGLTANKQYQDLLTNPTKFDPATVMNEPGYQFGLDQTTKAVDRSGRGLFNRKQLDAKTQNVLNYATTKYDQAFNRYMQSTQMQNDLIKGGVGIGQNANAAVQSAGNEYGGRVDAAGNTLGNLIGANADKTGALDVNAAEDQAALDLATSQAEATNQTLGNNNTVNTLGKVIEASPDILKGLAPGLAAKLGIGGAAGTLGAVTGAGSVVGGGIPITAGGLTIGSSAPIAAPTLAGVGGGSGLFGLGAATIPVLGAAAFVLAKFVPKLFGDKAAQMAADELTKPGGVHTQIKQGIDALDADTSITPQQRALAKEGLAHEIENKLVEFSKIDKAHYYKAKQTLQDFANWGFGVRPLLG